MTAYRKSDFELAYYAMCAALRFLPDEGFVPEIAAATAATTTRGVEACMAVVRAVRDASPPTPEARIAAARATLTEWTTKKEKE
jgi:hypothetical protein